jgi:hypothetical protein
MPGTEHDARMIVELAKLGAMFDLPDAVSYILSDSFDAETADITTPEVRTVLNFHETVGTLVSNGLLNRELVLDWIWPAGTWALVGPAARRFRERAGSANIYANYEALADAREQ